MTEHKVTADNFRKKPQKPYLKAYNGHKVIINHDRYPDKVFELTSRDREPLKEIKDE